MAEQIQELINKIKNEGIETANQKAKEIEETANTKASAIVDDAKKKADALIAKAKEEIAKMQKASEMAIKQASRDTLISLRKSIDSMLKGIIDQQVKESLSKDKLASMLSDIIKKYIESASDVTEVKVTLSEGDLKALKEDLIAKMQKELKVSITLEGTEDFEKGFTISFDSGKSCFDFSDKSLVEYISGFLNPQIAALINISQEQNEQ